nr:GNAT family protein [Anabaena sp. 4-3]
MQLDKIVAIARPENIPSRRVIEKVGMKYQKHAHYYGVDVVYYTLSQSEWRPNDGFYRIL